MITFDNFSGASLSFLIVNLFVVALLGVVILAAYRRRIRTLMRGGDAIAVNLPPEKPGGLQLRFNIITTPLTEHAPTQRFSILFDVLESVREHFYPALFTKSWRMWYIFLKYRMILLLNFKTHAFKGHTGRDGNYPISARPVTYFWQVADCPL